MTDTGPTDPSLYVVDTNIWIGLIYLTPTLLPDLWHRLERLASDGRIAIPEEVVRETHPTHHPGRWVRDHPALHRPTAPIWDLAHEIADRYPDLARVQFATSWADPFLVSQAIAEKNQAGLWSREVVVVSNERSHLPRIAVPDACLLEGVRCLNLEEWFIEENWRFVIAPQEDQPARG